MKKIVKALRLFGFALLLIAAAFGMGLAGIFFPSFRDEYLDEETRTEQIDKREEDGDE